MKISKKDLFEVGLIYLAVAVLGYVAMEVVEGHSIFRAAVANTIMTFVIFCVSLWKENSSAYDAYWSVIPSFLTIWLIIEPNATSWGLWQWATMLLVNCWSWRLTYNWATGWSGWEHEDWRYIQLRHQTGRLYPLVNLTGIHFFPTALVFLACLSLFQIASSSVFTKPLMVIGLSIGFAGVIIEAISDAQLRKFRTTVDEGISGHTRTVLRTGIWKYIRYPNYLGELMFWWGLAILGLGAEGKWWLMIGALGMIALFVFVSIPMKNQRMEKRYAAYKDYRSQTPAFLPTRNHN
tara:strand:+ start:1668 stop:2546 length:879 start_codon:yes stop_codon:yes gene_type:complete